MRRAGPPPDAKSRRLCALAHAFVAVSIYIGLFLLLKSFVFSVNFCCAADIALGRSRGGGGLRGVQSGFHKGGDPVVDNRGTLLAWQHHPDEQGELDGEVEGEPKEQHFSEVLQQSKEAVNDPIGEPLLIVVLVRRLEGEDARIYGVDEPDEVAEEAVTEDKVAEHDSEEGDTAEDVHRLDLGLFANLLDLGELLQVVIKLVQRLPARRRERGSKRKGVRSGGPIGSGRREWGRVDAAAVAVDVVVGYGFVAFDSSESGANQGLSSRIIQTVIPISFDHQRNRTQSQPQPSPTQRHATEPSGSGSEQRGRGRGRGRGRRKKGEGAEVDSLELVHI